ncbi:Callose synthase 3 [Euphorbia peplus]|nr:Callose synthase 3 [Euphorbia peplus]
MEDQISNLVDSMHGGPEEEEMISFDQQYQLFASSGTIRFPIQLVTKAWKEKIKRLYLLHTTNEFSMDVPSNLEAKRRISFFANSLFTDMPTPPKVRNMLSFSVLTPYYTEEGSRTYPDLASSLQGSDLGAVILNLKSVLKLISEMVMVVTECKRFVSQTLNTLLSEKDTDASRLLSILDVIKGWIEDDFSKQGSSSSSAFLHPKVTVSLLQKLSEVDKQSFHFDAKIV